MEVREADIYGAGTPHPEIDKWSCLPQLKHLYVLCQMMEAAESLRINQPVAEYTGRVMLREEFEEMQPDS